MIQTHDLVICGGTMATASDEFRADIGISDGRIPARALDLPPCTVAIDAADKLVLSGGEAMDQIAYARPRGLEIFVETCSSPHVIRQVRVPTGAGWQTAPFRSFPRITRRSKFDNATGKKMRGEGASFAHVPNGMLPHNVDYTPYEGCLVTGWPEKVLPRGEVIVRDETLHVSSGRGKLLECTAPDTTL